MKKKARTLIILGAVLVVCIGAYIGVSVYNNAEAQKTAEEVRAALIYSSGRGTPASISYESGGTTLSFVLRDGSWYVADNLDFPLKQTSLTSLASALNDLTPVRTIDTPAALSTYGLDKPAYTLTAADSAGNALKLLIGAQNGGNYYAMTEGVAKVYTISSAIVGNLQSDLTGMIILETIPSVSEATIDTVRLSSDALTLTLDKHLNKDGTTTWFIVSGTTYTPAEELTLPEGTERTAVTYTGDAVAALTSAKFTSCAAFKPTDDALEAFGFGSTQMTVTVDYTNTTGSGLDQTSTKGTTVLEIGGALGDGGGYYARVQGSQQVDVLPAGTVDPLIAALSAMGSAE